MYLHNNATKIYSMTLKTICSVFFFSIETKREREFLKKGAMKPWLHEKLQILTLAKMYSDNTKFGHVGKKE